MKIIEHSDHGHGHDMYPSFFVRMIPSTDSDRASDKVISINSNKVGLGLLMVTNQQQKKARRKF